MYNKKFTVWFLMHMNGALHSNVNEVAKSNNSRK